MKKLVSFLLIVTLCFSLSISAFASYGGVELPSVDSVMESNPDYPYAVIHHTSGNTYYLSLASSNVFKVLNFNDSTYTEMVVGDKVRIYQCDVGGTSWKLVSSYEFGQANYPSNYPAPIWATHDVLREDGTLYLVGSVSPTVRECDGSSCPATDANHDNICDDCGNVLAFSLRSTLLDYAKSHAETNGNFSETHKYYAVVEHPTDPNKYIVYISAALMGSTDGGQTVRGGDMKQSIVVTMDSGSFGNQGWTSVDSWSGKVVYANQNIPFFFRVPLKVTVQGPTGEQMEMGTLELTTVMKTLTLCGVGLLALWMALRVLVRFCMHFLKV